MVLVARICFLLVAAATGLLAASFSQADVCVPQNEANAWPNDAFYAVGPANISCVMEAARRQCVAQNVLLALASLESGKNGQFVRNTNGSYDIGHFQLNTIHWTRGGAFFQHPLITQQAVAQRGCFNAELAAWLLRRAQSTCKSTDFWRCSANYHSATPGPNQVYRRKLIALSREWGNWLKTNYPSGVSVTYQRVARGTPQ